MRSPLLLGIDIGTSGCKAIVYDERGVKHGSGYARYELLHPIAGFAEQRPADWWAAVVAAVRHAVKESGNDSIAGIAISSSNGLVLVDGAGDAIRPAIMQLDERAKSEALELEVELASGKTLERAINPLKAGPSWLPTLRWLQKHEPSALRRAQSLVFPGGWLTLQLTGESWIDYSRASTTMLLDPRLEVWQSELLGAVGVEPKQLPHLSGSTNLAGLLREPQAREMGLQQGIPVAVGAMDSAAAALGAGALSVGDAVLALGTTARVMAVTRTLEAHPSLISCGYPIPGLWLMMGVVWRAGTALRSAASQWTGTSDFGRLDAEASSVAASETEFRYDADSGAFLGRTPEHGPAHVARAVMEGVADSLNARSRLIESHLDRPLSKVVIVGGGSRSTLLTRLVAQRLRCDVAISSDPDAEPRGAAIIAAAAAGVYPDLLSAARAMSRAGGEPC